MVKNVLWRQFPANERRAGSCYIFCHIITKEIPILNCVTLWNHLFGQKSVPQGTRVQKMEKKRQWRRRPQGSPLVYVQLEWGGSVVGVLFLFYFCWANWWDTCSIAVPAFVFVLSWHCLLVFAPSRLIMTYPLDWFRCLFIIYLCLLSPLCCRDRFSVRYRLLSGACHDCFCFFPHVMFELLADASCPPDEAFSWKIRGQTTRFLTPPGTVLAMGLRDSFPFAVQVTFLTLSWCVEGGTDVWSGMVAITGAIMLRDARNGPILWRQLMSCKSRFSVHRFWARESCVWMSSFWWGLPSGGMQLPQRRNCFNPLCCVGFSLFLIVFVSFFVANWRFAVVLSGALYLLFFFHWKMIWICVDWKRRWFWLLEVTLLRMCGCCCCFSTRSVVVFGVLSLVEACWCLKL